MKVFGTFFTIALLIALITGCASGPRFSEMKSSIPTLNPDTGRIYIYRKGGPLGVQPKIYINGENTGRAKPKGFFYVDRPAGNYEIETITEVKRKITVPLDSGQTRYVRIKFSIGFLMAHAKPELVNEEFGASEIQKMKYTGNELEIDEPESNEMKSNE